MANTLNFKNEESYLEWESLSGNTIYALQNTAGKYIGDIREVHLIKFLAESRIVSLDNPTEKEVLFVLPNITELGEANYSITNDTDKEVFEKLVLISYNKI